MPRELLILAITLALVALVGVVVSAVAGRSRARKCQAPAGGDTRPPEIAPDGPDYRDIVRARPYESVARVNPARPEGTPENPYGYTEVEIATGYRTSEHGGHIESYPIPVEHILVIELRRVNATTALLRAEMAELRGRLEAMK